MQIRSNAPRSHPLRNMPTGMPDGSFDDYCLGKTRLMLGAMTEIVRDDSLKIRAIPIEQYAESLEAIFTDRKRNVDVPVGCRRKRPKRHHHALSGAGFVADGRRHHSVLSFTGGRKYHRTGARTASVSGDSARTQFLAPAFPPHNLNQAGWG